MTFAIDLEIYRGPADLLLYLVRHDELDVADIPVGIMAEQYLQYLDQSQAVDVNQAGDFLEIASTLTEFKTAKVLPRPEADTDEAPVESPREDLVTRLLEYKWFRDAASILDERSRQWQQRRRRLSGAPGPAVRNLADEPLHEVQIWDLVSAFSRLIRENRAIQPANIVYDDTPIHIYMRQIHGRLAERGRVAFSEMFQPGMHKSSLVSIFLATMELIRGKAAVAEQEKLFGEIWIMPTDEQPRLDFSAADEYAPHSPAKPK